MALRQTIEVVRTSTVTELAEQCQDAIDNGKQLHGTPFWGIEKGTDGVFCQMVTLMVNTKLD